MGQAISASFECGGQTPLCPHAEGAYDEQIRAVTKRRVTTALERGAQFKVHYLLA